MRPAWTCYLGHPRGAQAKYVNSVEYLNLEVKFGFVFGGLPTLATIKS